MFATFQCRLPSFDLFNWLFLINKKNIEKKQKKNENYINSKKIFNQSSGSNQESLKSSQRIMSQLNIAVRFNSAGKREFVASVRCFFYFTNIKQKKLTKLVLKGNFAPAEVTINKNFFLVWYRTWDEGSIQWPQSGVYY